jgi:hypothetical protein
MFDDVFCETGLPDSPSLLFCWPGYFQEQET